MGIRKCNFTYDARQEEVVAQECDLILFDDWVGIWVSYRVLQNRLFRQVDDIVVGSTRSVKANV